MTKAFDALNYSELTSVLYLISNNKNKTPELLRVGEYLLNNQELFIEKTNRILRETLGKLRFTIKDQSFTSFDSFYSLEVPDPSNTSLSKIENSEKEDKFDLNDDLLMNLDKIDKMGSIGDGDLLEINANNSLFSNNSCGSTQFLGNVTPDKNFGESQKEQKVLAEKNNVNFSYENKPMLRGNTPNTERRVAGNNENNMKIYKKKTGSFTVGEKWEAIYDGLKKDKVETADFTGAGIVVN